MGRSSVTAAGLRRPEMLVASYWATVDPTPSGEVGEQELGLLAQLRQYADAFRMRWYRYVVEYDLEQQVGAIVTLRDTWRNLGKSLNQLTPREANSRRRAIWFLGVRSSAYCSCGLSVGIGASDYGVHRRTGKKELLVKSSFSWMISVFSWHAMALQKKTTRPSANSSVLSATP